FVGRITTQAYYFAAPITAAYLNDGDGGLVEAPVPPGQSVGGRRIALGDVDGDGDLDAMIAYGLAAPTGPTLYLNGGTGGFTYAFNHVPQLLAFYLDVALGDFDGDGDLDALFGTGTAPSLSVNPHMVFRNIGAGFFSYVAAATPSSAFG